jgi:multicomponent Na+:H+ antiporter subunit G
MIVRDWISAALLLTGATLMLLAAVGVVRMPDLYSRMQAATKASSLGVGCMLLAVAVHFADLAITTRAFMIIVFFLLTAPVSAHMIGRVAYFLGVPTWRGTILDELRGRYDPRTHALDSESPEPSA